MKLLLIYAGLVAVGEAAAIGLGEVFEITFPRASLLVFLGLFFFVLYAAWRLALRITA
jgi:hypothetical protein